MMQKVQKYLWDIHYAIFYNDKKMFAKLDLAGTPEQYHPFKCETCG